jgi:hypothetical protein
MKIQVIKQGAVKSKKQGCACDIMIDEPPMNKG